MYGQIYLVTNKVNGKRYVGQTIRTVARRWDRHRKDARDGVNKALSNAIRKYGPENFEIRAIADAPDKEILNNFEYFYIKHLDLMNSEKGYNRRDGGGQPKFGPETIAKFSALRKGRKLTPEWKQKIAESLKGREVSAENRELSRQRMMGNTHSLGIKRSEETKAKMRGPKSPEHREKISLARKGKGVKFGAENAFFGKKHTEETKAKIRAARLRNKELANGG